jgi:nicotinic acid mononucleotide adenylyltransferase
LNSYRTRFPNVSLILIAGADNMALHKWKDIEQFPSLLSRIVAVARPDYEAKFKEDLEASRKQYPVVADMVEFLADIDLPISSTEVRESLRNGKIPNDLLHPSVSHHIYKYGLYGCREVCEG